MKHLLLIALFFVCLASVAKPKVKYKTHAELIEETKKKAEVRMWDSATTAKELSLIPKGGSLEIKIVASTLELAKPSNYMYIVQDMKGNEIKRDNGSVNQIPSYEIFGSQTFWYAFDGIILEFEQQPFKLFIVDKVFNKRYEYEIDPAHNKYTKL